MRARRAKGENPLASRRGPLLILLVALLAVPIAYFVLGRGSPPLKQAPEANLAALESQSVARAAAPQREPELAAAESRVLPPAPHKDGQASERSDPEPKTIGAGARSTPAAGTASAVAPSEPATALAATRSEALKTTAAPVQKLSPAEVEFLLKHGQQFMAVGDLAAARVVFRRAAEAGDAAAALAMGATYDPLVLSRIGALGVRADPDLARTWYERAKDFGSPEAPRRIDMLANR
jgi:TPR repeat protein